MQRRQCNCRTESQGQKFSIHYCEEMEGEQETKCKNLCEMKQLLHLPKAQDLLRRNAPRFPPDCSRVISWWIHMVTMGFDLKNERCTLPFPSPFQLHQCLPFPSPSQSSIALMPQDIVLIVTMPIRKVIFFYIYKCISLVYLFWWKDSEEPLNFWPSQTYPGHYQSFDFTVYQQSTLQAVLQNSSPSICNCKQNRSWTAGQKHNLMTLLAVKLLSPYI